ncbi:hypothetical protein TUE45_04642 [Streptomyces reticuli]|nr:hypothetical protein TUE45_04642 [Streptomyces reticuli]
MSSRTPRERNRNSRSTCILHHPTSRSKTQKSTSAPVCRYRFHGFRTTAGTHTRRPDRPETAPGNAQADWGRPGRPV